MSPGITADQPITEAVRALLGRQLAVFVEHEALYRAGSRRRAVHQMRVALRRMRSLLDLHGDCFTRRTVNELVAGMRQAGRMLGDVRDLDVMIADVQAYGAALPDDVQAYGAALPDDERESFLPLLEACKSRRKAARRRLRKHLGSKRHRRFVGQLSAFTASPGLGVTGSDGAVVGPQRVRHVLGSRIWRRYEAVWAYDPVLENASPETMHTLRIEVKRLRYALEPFIDVLGTTRANPLIAQVVALQDCLGLLHDADVAGKTLEFAGKDHAAARKHYLANRQQGIGEVSSTFPVVWEKVDSLRYRRNLAAMLAAL